MDTRTLQVRQRLPAALIGLAIFVGFGRWFDPHFFTTVTFAVGVGVFASATFIEPFFTRPQDALVNSLAGLVAVIAIDKSPEDGLWLTYAVLLSCVLVAALVATVVQNDASALKWMGRRISSLFGRAVVVGPAALLIDCLTRASRGEKGVGLLVAGTAILTTALAVHWERFRRGFGRLNQETAIALAAVGPRMLLAGATHGALDAGTAVEVTGQGAVSGTIVARLPHQQGTRYQIALDEDWSNVCGSFPYDVELRILDEPSTVLGSVGEGSTEVSIEFGPLTPLRIGQPVVLDMGGEELIYQIARLQLRMAGWSGASSLVAHATARQVGLPRDGLLVATDYLPAPHQPVRQAEALTADLPAGYLRIGKVKGTEIPIGLAEDQLRRGHLAILGMSGMGKTAVAERIASGLGQSELVIALDLTGEYSGRLGFPTWQNMLDAQGHFVYEPVGEPSLKARDLVKDCMQHAAQEYAAGQQPRHREILLEEAHSFIPEWNFVGVTQRDNVNDTTRMIMQARKYGLRFIVVSQRTAVVSKSALSQCDNYIVFRTIDHTGLEYIESLAGTAFRDTLTNLGKYEALCMGPAFNAEQPVIVELDAPPVNHAVPAAAAPAPAVEG